MSLVSGRLDSNQRPPEPHSGCRSRKAPFFPRISQSALSSYYRFYENCGRWLGFLLPLLPYGARGESPACGPKSIGLAFRQPIEQKIKAQISAADGARRDETWQRFY